MTTLNAMSWCVATVAATIGEVFVPAKPTLYSCAPAGMGNGAALVPPGNVVKCFVLQMLSKVSVNKVFMNYFKKMSSASAGLAGALTLDPAGGLLSFRLPHCPMPTHGNNLRTPMTVLTMVRSSGTHCLCICVFMFHTA